MSTENDQALAGNTTEELLSIATNPKGDVVQRQKALATLYQKRVAPQHGIELQCNHIECAVANFVLELSPLVDNQTFTNIMGIQTFGLDEALNMMGLGPVEDTSVKGDEVKDDTKGFGGFKLN